MPVLTTALLATLVVADPPTLPLRKLRLYETGVGYFERRGNVGARDDLSLPIPASHLDDALKSLVILEATGGVKIEGVDFGSSVSEAMARAMAGLPDEGVGPLGYADVLRSLKGSQVQLSTTDGKIRGRLIDLEGPFYAPEQARKGDADDDATVAGSPQGEAHYTLIVLDEDDALRRVKTDRVQGVRVIDEHTAERLDVAATALSDQAARQRTALRVQVADGGRLALGYVSESPVWRTTYRVVMDDDARGQLQAWALVHNDTDEDWDAVQVELANGRPTSFLHPLASPRYVERELVEPPEGLSTVPQLANRTVDGIYGGEFGEAYGAGGMGLVGHGYGGGGSGDGTIGMGSVTTIDGAGVTLGDLAELAKAAGSESGSLFLYRVADPIDLQAHHSALLPLVQAAVEVEPITLFAVDAYEGLSAARLVNSTTQTLPPGTVSFFADGGFVGEAMFDRLKPSERRFVPYGFELDVELTRSRTTIGEEIAVLRWDEEHHVLSESYLLESKITLALHNRSGRGRKVYVALDLPRHADLTADAGLELDYDLANDLPLAATTVAAGAEVSHALQARELRHRRHEAVDLRLLEQLRDRPGLATPQRQVLDRSIELLDRAHRLGQEAVRAQQTIDRIERDLERIRKDLSALGDAGGRSPARSRLTRDLADKESRIDTLRKSIEEGVAEAEQATGRAMTNLEHLDDWKPAAASGS